MRFVLSLIIVAMIIGPMIGLLKRRRLFVYSIAVFSQLVYLSGKFLGWHGAAWVAFASQMQRCTLAFVLFSVVMFIGVFDEKSRIRNHLVPVRQQLSIMACVFTFGHIGYYLSSYLPRIGSITKMNVGFSLALSFLLTAMLVILLITSFSLVKKRMNGNTWKLIQRLAYPFYVFASVHAVAFLLPSAFAGRVTAIEGGVFYGCSAVAFLFFRIRKAVLLKRAKRVASRNTVLGIKVPNETN